MLTALVQSNSLQIPLADNSVNCVVTSPPYWSLRDYGTAEWINGDPDCDHNPQRPDGGERADRTLPLGRGGIFKDICGICGAKRIDKQLGLEQTPEEYVERMVEVFREVRRVLHPSGTVWLNLGDSYAGSGGVGNQRDDANKGNLPYFKNPNSFEITKSKRIERGNGRWGGGNSPTSGYLKPKDLVGIPWRVAFALQANGWWLRSDIIWFKPNPMPESVTDRPTKSHEYMFLLSKGKNYFYDQEAIREPVKDITISRLGQFNFDNQEGGEKDPGNGNRSERRTLENLKGRYSRQGVWDKRFTGYELWKEKGIGRNRRTVWEIATQPYSGAHFATYPEALVEPCIKAGTSEKGCCPKCGTPWKRIGKPSLDYSNWQPTCSCNAGDPVPCIVLDPFVGSGTTLLVARRLRRDAVGLDLSYTYLHDQARKRLGLDKLKNWEAA
jgi:DNA modification methylase